MHKNLRPFLVLHLVRTVLPVFHAKLLSIWFPNFTANGDVSGFLADDL